MEGNEEADGRHDEKNPTRDACEAQRLFEDSEGPAGEAAHDPVLEHRGQMLLNFLHLHRAIQGMRQAYVSLPSSGRVLCSMSNSEKSYRIESFVRYCYLPQMDEQRKYAILLAQRFWQHGNSMTSL